MHKRELMSPSRSLEESVPLSHLSFEPWRSGKVIVILLLFHKGCTVKHFSGCIFLRFGFLPEIVTSSDALIMDLKVIYELLILLIWIIGILISGHSVFSDCILSHFSWQLKHFSLRMDLWPIPQGSKEYL